MPGIGAHHEPAGTAPARRALVPLALGIALLLVLRRRRS
jgi:MYXO-CTERM domain-containing protein